MLGVYLSVDICICSTCPFVVVADCHDFVVVVVADNVQRHELVNVYEI